MASLRASKAKAPNASVLPQRTAQMHVLGRDVESAKLALVVPATLAHEVKRSSIDIFFPTKSCVAHCLLKPSHGTPTSPSLLATGT